MSNNLWKAGLVIWVVSVAFISLVAYVAVHFISKFW